MKRFIATALTAVSVALTVTSCTPAAETPAPAVGTSLTIANGYVMAPLKGRDVAAGYFMATNAGETLSIVAATSDSAEAVELHTHTMENGVMKMREVDGVEIPAGGSVEFKPGSFHLMMFGFERADGQSAASVTLTLENGERLDLSLPIRDRS